MRYSLHRLLEREGDTQFAVFKKKVMFVAMSVGLVIYGAAFAMNKNVAQVMGLVGCTGYLVHLAVAKRADDRAAEAAIYFGAAAVLMMDMRTSVVAYKAGTWQIFVLFVDICLVCRFPTRIIKILVATITTWLVVLAFEETFRFGFFEWSYLPSQDERRDALDCDEVPCKTNAAFIELAAKLIVFLLDFYFTRKFATDLHAEHDKMTAAITATERIASSLSRFDLALAESILNTACLPLPLDTAFRDILSNLEMYRPYIPDALFALHTNQTLKQAPAPGVEREHVTLVFTDIRGSTATWEACPEGMSEALEVHNRVMRDCIAVHSGYEVKTIGDAFMVAFEDATSAVQFGLAVQERLLEAAWPSALLALDHCKRTADGMWCGLRVRVGVHCGEVDVQLNTLTGRYDYFGNTVNKAARMEGVCIGGAVAVTEEVLDEARHLEGVCVMEMGNVTLKGISCSVGSFLLLPDSLVGRREFVMEQLRVSRRDRRPVMRVESDASSQGSRLSSDKRALVPHSAVVSFGIIEVQRGTGGSEIIEALDNGLERVVTWTERTHGTVVSLQGSRVAVCWNGLKPCVTHVENSLAFVQMLGMGEGVADKHCGVVTGNVVCGTVGSRRQKFVTVLGGCAVAAGKLASRAVVRKVLSYYAGHSLPEQFLLNLGLQCDDAGTQAVDGHELPVLEISMGLEVETLRTIMSA